MNSYTPLKSACPLLLLIILGVFAILCSAGINWVENMKYGPLGFPDTRNFFNAFFVTTARTEPGGLFVVLLFSVLAVYILYRAKIIFPNDVCHSKKTVYWLALGTFTVSLIGVWVVMHDHPLAADENMTDFQAEIFASGKLQGEIPGDLQPVAHALKPLQVNLSRGKDRWNQSYLPVYAALRAPFLLVHMQTVLNPLLGVVSVLGMAGICRIVWPDKPWLAVAGSALTALSPQILITGMTSYAMPAHLALNTIWLWLHLRRDSKGYWLAPIVGVLAVGLHSPFVHALFVTPFLCMMLIKREWKPALWYGLVYLLGCIGYFMWWRFFAPGNTNVSTALFSISRPGYLLSQAINFLNLASWQALPVPFLVGVAIWKIRSLPTVLKVGGVSCLLTFGFYASIGFDQGLGWGNRYFYGVLSLFFLIALHGLDSLATQIGQKRSWDFFLVGMLTTIIFQIPLRCWQTEQFIRPFAFAAKSFRNLDVDLIIYDPRTAWYSTELRRNNPTLTNRPLIVNLMMLNQQDAEFLRHKFPKIYFVTKDKLASYGLSTQRWQSKE